MPDHPFTECGRPNCSGKEYACGLCQNCLAGDIVAPRLNIPDIEVPPLPLTVWERLDKSVI